MVAFWAVRRSPRFLLLLAIRAAVSRAPLQAGYGCPEACLPRRNAVNRSSAALKLACTFKMAELIKSKSLANCAEPEPLIMTGKHLLRRAGEKHPKTQSTQKKPVLLAAWLNRSIARGKRSQRRPAIDFIIALSALHKRRGRRRVLDSSKTRFHAPAQIK